MLSIMHFIFWHRQPNRLHHCQSPANHSMFYCNIPAVLAGYICISTFILLLRYYVSKRGRGGGGSCCRQTALLLHASRQLLKLSRINAAFCIL